MRIDRDYYTDAFTMKKTILAISLLIFAKLVSGDEPINVNTKTHLVSTPNPIDFSNVTVLGLPFNQYSFQASLINDNGTVTLVNDTYSPGILEYYGTDGNGTLGYHNLCSGLSFADSIINTSGIVTLVGDTASPAASQYYGTNGSSVLGFYDLPSGGGSVNSVFGRSGDVVATTGDYTAAQVTNAVDTTATYSDPSWITSLAWSKITGSPSFGTVTSVDLSMPNGGFTITGNPVTTSGTLTATQHIADSTHDGYLSSTDWNTFNGKQPAGSYVPTSRSLTIGPTTSDLSSDRTFLGNVTNDAQTKSAIVPNTAPSAGQILAGNAGGTAYAPVTLSGSGATATLSSAGVLTLSGIANATLSNSSITIGGTSTALGGSVLGNVTNDAQTKSAVVPNTAPSSGQLLVGNAGGTAYAPITLSGPVSVTSAGVTSVATLNQNTTGSAATLTIARNLWGQSFNGSADVTGSLTSVGDITGGASNMAITAGTGNSRTLTLKSTTSGGTATAFLTGNADQSSTFGGNISGTGAWTLTGGAGNMTITSGTGNSRTMALQSTTSGGTATTFLTGNADQTVTFASGFTAAGSSSIGASNQFTTGTVLIGSPSGTLGYTDGTGHLTIGATNVANFADPLSVFTRSTSNTIGVGNIELGNATDTTLSRLGAGSLGVEGTAVILNGGALGTPSSGTLTNCTFPTLNQDTTGSAVYWKTSGTGKASITGPATGTTRAYTFPDADSTMLYSGGALGTPSSATLTNATGLPVAGITSSTSTALGVGSIELGNASDTTLSRSGAGVLAVEGVKVLATNSTSGTQQGLIAVNSSSGAVVGTQARAFGTSASGTAGTSVASITAGGGNQFVCINGFANQANSSATQLTLTVTYSDSTTTSFTTTAATAGLVFVNDASITASSNIGQTGNSTKKITGISVVTAGVGTGSRQASLAAVEIPQ